MFHFRSEAGRGTVQVLPLKSARGDSNKVSTIQVQLAAGEKMRSFSYVVRYSPHSLPERITDEEFARIAIAQAQAAKGGGAVQDDLDFTVLPWSGNLEED